MSINVKFFADGAAKLSKVVPQHVHAVEFRWCHQNFQAMSPEWRKARLRVQIEHDACRWCKHEFVDGQMMALAQPKKGTNWLLCQGCAATLTGDAAEVSDAR